MKPSVKRLGTGRPTKYSEEVILRLCEALADGMPIKGACVVAGIDVTTLAGWREKHPRLEDRMSKARELARQNALQAIKAEKDWRAQAEWLRLTFPEDYRGGQKVEVQQAVQVQVTAEQLEDLRRRLPAARALFGASATLRTESELPEKENEDEVDSPEKAEPAPCSPATTAVQVNYAGLPMQPGDFGYGGKP